MPWFTVQADAIPEDQIKQAAIRLVNEAQNRIAPKLDRVLLLPPDLTRAHSGVGKITEWVYDEVMRRNPRRTSASSRRSASTFRMLRRRTSGLFGSIPNEIILPHDWRNGVSDVGTIPASLVEETTGGVADWEIPVDLNSTLMDEPWDLIVSLRP